MHNCGYSQAFNFQELSLQQGLPQSQAYALTFDSTQHVWIGTQGGGVCRYDGNSFLYLTKNDSLISNRIFSLEQINAEMWIGQKGGASVFDLDLNFQQNYPTQDPTIAIQDMTSYNDKILFCTDHGLMTLKNDSILPYTKNVSLVEVNAYEFFLSDNELWVCTDQGLLSFEDPMKKITKAKGLSAIEVTTVLEYNDYWLIGTYGGGIDAYNKSSARLNPGPFLDLQEKIILTMMRTRSGELWVGTLNNGVYVMNSRGETVRHFHSGNGLSNDHVRNIHADYWGNVWIGTSGGGVCVFQNSPFIAYNSNAGLNGDYIYAVQQSRKNNLWVSTDGLGVVRITDTSAVTFDEEYGFFAEKVKAIFEDADGDMWMGTDGKGLGIYSQYDEKDTIYTFSTSGGLSSDWIRSFAQHPITKEIFIGTLGGGIMTVKKDWKFPIELNPRRLKASKGDFPDRINDLDFIEDKLWWVGANGDYGWYQNSKVYALQENETVFRNIVGSGAYRWLGSSDEGIMRIKVNSDSIQEKGWINESSGLSSNNIYQLLLDGFNLWVGTEKGLDRVSLDSAYEIKSIEHFGYEEGFEGVESNINAACKDADGGLWFGTVNGLYKYQGGEINYEQRKPPVLQLTDFSIFYESIEKTEFHDHYENGEMKEPLLLPYDMNHIGFSFKAIHYTYSKNIRYRWRLKGADPQWTPPSKITTATYSNLPPGKYTFYVKASIDDDWDLEPKSVSFEIDQPYYEKFWFKISYYSLIGMVILLVVLLVFLRIRRKNKRLREKFELEKNLVELEQKALRLQMNPHFIFNVLTSIHNLIILNDPDKARYALSKFSKLMRRVLENSRQKFISIDDEIETLENYVQLEKLTGNLDVELDIEIDEDLDPAEEILPPLMIQPFVENAIIHGLKDIDHPGRIKVTFKLLHEHLLECAVEDNGRGRIAAADANEQKENYHKSTALEVTQERLASLNPSADYLPFEIIDLKDDEGKPSGTKVIFRLAI